MPYEQLNSYPHQNFMCDSCQGEFENETAYSSAPNFSQIEGYHTYCSNCVEPVKEVQPRNKRAKKNWGTAPVNETTENIKSLEIDKRTLKKTGRVHLFGTRVTKEWLAKLKTIAYEERLKYVEVLEKALECYEDCRN